MSATMFLWLVQHKAVPSLHLLVARLGGSFWDISEDCWQCVKSAFYVIDQKQVVLSIH